MPENKQENPREMTQEELDFALSGNEAIEEAILSRSDAPSGSWYRTLTGSLLKRIGEGGGFLVPLAPAGVQKEDMELFKPLKLASEDGKNWMVVYTGAAEAEKSDDDVLICYKIQSLFERVLAQDVLDGLALNPCGDLYLLSEEQIRMILGGV